MKLLVNLFSWFILCILLLCACQNSPSNSNENQSMNENRPTIESKPSTSTQVNGKFDLTNAISVESKTVNGNPESTITFVVRDKQLIITEPSECRVLSAEEFEDYDIHESAGAACQCWWAGTGTDYVVRKGQVGVQIIKRLTDESKESTPSKWLLLKTF